LSSIENRLKSALSRRDSLLADVQRARGRLESAKENLLRLEADCRARGIDPNSLDELESQLNQKLESLVTTLNDEVASLQSSLSRMES
jgi:uncharacterized protein YceH (UPF0502 family)